MKSISIRLGSISTTMVNVAATPDVTLRPVVCQDTENVDLVYHGSGWLLVRYHPVTFASVFGCTAIADCVEFKENHDLRINKPIPCDFGLTSYLTRSRWEAAQLRP